MAPEPTDRPGPLLPWRFATFCVALMLAARALLLTGAAESGDLSRTSPLPGFGYDVFAAAALLLVGGAAGLLPWRLARSLTRGAPGLVASLLLFANQIHVRFFREALDPSRAGRVSDLWVVRTGILHLVHLQDVLLLLAVPLALLGWSLSREQARAAPDRRELLAALAVLLVGVTGNWVGNRFRPHRRPDPLLTNVVLRFTQSMFSARREANAAQALEVKPEWLTPASARADFPLEEGSRFLDVEGFPLLRHRGLVRRDERLKAAGIDVDALRALGGQPNLVIVVLESLGASELHPWGNAWANTPNLDRLTSESLWVERFYAAANISIKGEFAIQCGFQPNTQGEETIVRNPRLAATCLPEILAGRGYTTRWFTAYLRHFDNQGPFELTHGVQTVWDQTNPPKGVETLGMWGVSDRALYENVLDELAKTREPFSATITNVSNHYPFTHPEGWPGVMPHGMAGEYEGKLRGVDYVDFALGHFLEKARRMPYFERTVFLFVADHGLYLFPSDEDWDKRGGRIPDLQRDELYFRIPFVMWAPKLVRPTKLEGPASQVDILPTVLDLVAAEADGTFSGRSLFSDQKGRRLLMSGLHGFSGVEGDVRCWGDRGACVRTGPALYGNHDVAKVEAPELSDWADRAARVAQFLGRTDHLLPPQAVMERAKGMPTADAR